MAFKGGCLCGAIRYECSSDPLMAVYCHCRNCQITSGGGYSTNVMAPLGSLTITAGELVSYDDSADSGNTIVRQFCGKCGSPIATRMAEGVPMVVIKAASMDDPSGLEPGMSIWEDSAQPWSPKHEGLRHFGKSPG